MNTSMSRTQTVLTFAFLLAFSIYALSSLASVQEFHTHADPRSAPYNVQPTTTAAFQVDYINVGQGDAIYLHASDGTDILIDGGPRSAGPTVVAHLQNAGVDDIEVMVLTHPDADHEGGLIDVLQSAIPVESWIYNGQHDNTLTYQQLITETQKRGLTPTPAVAGQFHRWGDVQAYVLNPQPVLDPDQNDNSVTMLVVYGNVRFLFTGDITTDTEQALLELGTAWLPLALPADILKVAHHGSNNSSSTAFLEAVNPEVAIISVGQNPYGHPAQETLDRLAAVGAKVYRTDKFSTVTVTSDGHEYEVLADYVIALPCLMCQPAPTPANTPFPSAMPTNTATPTASGDSAATATPTSTPGAGSEEGWHIENVFSYFDEDFLEFYVQGEIVNDTQDYMRIVELWPVILDDAGEPVTSEADVSVISKDYAQLREIVRLAPEQSLAFSFVIEVPSEIYVEDNYDFVIAAEPTDDGRDDLDILDEDFDDEDWPYSLYVNGVYDIAGDDLSAYVAIVVTLYGDYDKVLGVGWSYESGGAFLETGAHDFEVKVQMWEALDHLELELYSYKVQVFGY